MFAEKLDWDTHFFGYGIGKIHGIFPLEAPFYRPTADYGQVLSQLIENAKQKEIVYLFASVDPRDLATLRALGDAGFCLIDTRITYHRNIKNYDYPERFAVRVANEGDVDSLGRTSQEMANLYDRFHSDPFITPQDADRIMYRWIEASILGSFADITLVPDVAQPRAFITLKYLQQNWAAWGLRMSRPGLSAVSPIHRGWFRKLLSEAIYHLCDIGVEHIFVPTQAANKAIIWVCESLGLHYGKCELVFRKTI